MPGEQAEYDLIRVLDSQADSKQDTFFISPKEIGRAGSGLQTLTVESVGEPDAPADGQIALFLDDTSTVKAKAPDGTVTTVSEQLDPTTVDITQLQNSDTKADLTQPGGVLTSSQIPQLSITSVTTVADQTARLNLTAQEGDVAVQTDTGEAYVLSTNDPTVDSNWIEISIDVLSQIDSQQITPSQVGTSSSPSTVVSDTTTANNIATQSVADDYLYAGAFDGSIPDARLSNCLNAASVGDVVYLENTAYTQDQTIDTLITMRGTGQIQEGSHISDALFSFTEPFSTIENVGLDCSSASDGIKMGFSGQADCIVQLGTKSGTITATGSSCIFTRLRQVDVTLNGDNCVVDSSTEVAVTDNGSNNVIGDIV
jgi:hypothetical protein